MHELSIVMSIIDIAAKEAISADAIVIEEIELDIGCLSTVEIYVFEFAWQQAIKNTALEKAQLKINRIEGKAQCNHCNEAFVIRELYDACPRCDSHQLTILQGKELRINKLVVMQPIT